MKASPSLLAAASLVALLAPGAVAVRPAHADGNAHDCNEAYEKAQRQRLSTDLRGARDTLRLCVQATCSPLIVEDCTTWLHDVELGIPTLIVAARDVRGADVTDLRVLVDGVLRAEKLDGLPLEINPGQHVLRLEGAGTSVSQTLLINQAERNRLLHVTVPDPPPPPATSLASATSASPSRSPLPYLVGGAGLALLAAGVGLDISGTVDRSNLVDSCDGHCSQSSVDHAHTKLVVGDILAGTGLVALAAGVWLFVSPPGRGGEQRSGPNSVAVGWLGSEAALRVRF